MQREMIMMLQLWAKKLSVNPMGPPIFLNAIPRSTTSSMYNHIEPEDYRVVPKEEERYTSSSSSALFQHNFLGTSNRSESVEEQNDREREVKSPPSIVRTSQD